MRSPIPRNFDYFKGADSDENFKINDRDNKLMKIRDKKTENKILKAALNQFGDKGYFKTTVDDIALAAGIGKGTVYLHFKSKDAIFTATCVWQLDQILDNIITAINKATTAEQKLYETARYLSGYVNRIRSSYPLFNLMNIHLSAHAIKGLRSKIMPKMIKMNQTVAEVMAEGIANREFREIDPQIAAFLFLNLVRSYFMSRIFKLDYSSDVKEILTIFFEGIKRRQNA